MSAGRRLAPLAGSLLLAGCATLEGNSYSIARTPIARAEAAYDRVHEVAIAALPFLPTPIAERARTDLAAADAAIAVIRRDASAAERIAALQDLAVSVAKIVAAVRAR